MRAFIFTAVAALAASVDAMAVDAMKKPDKDGKYELKAEGIRANFIPYGASLSNLFIKDKHGIERDIVLGYDNASYYSVDKSHPHLGGVPGRYANRIANGEFTIDGKTYHVSKNENGNTLHGGKRGWDWRNFTVDTVTDDSITFSIVDPAGDQGFPGEVISYITYTLSPYTWTISMTARATEKKTPIMLSSHVYWNLDGYQNPDTDLALNHTFYLPYSGQRVGVDGELIPTGTILPNKKGTPNDWWSAPKQLGADIHDKSLKGNCGTGCQGYDNCYFVNREAPFDWRESGPVASLWSDWSGIRVDISTDQDAFQMYSCNGQDGTMALKKTQGFFGKNARPRVVNQYSCMVMEVEDWIDGINQPEWQKKQVWGPEDPAYTLDAVYKFSVQK